MFWMSVRLIVAFASFVMGLIEMFSGGNLALMYVTFGIVMCILGNDNRNRRT